MNFKGFSRFNKIVQELLVPPRLYHWKTLILLSFLLWLSAAFAYEDRELSSFLTDCGWLSMTIGIGWRTSQKPFVIQGISLSPWIVGFLICLYLWENFPPNRQPFAAIAWPLISLCLAVFINFFQSGATLQPSPPFIRPIFLIVILIHGLVSCWLGFHFVIQGWLKEYPSLLAEDFRKSGFVVNLQPHSVNRSRGIILINLMEKQLRDKTRNRSWEEVAQWLINLSNQPLLLRDTIFRKVPKLPENYLWVLETPIVQGQSRYKIELLAIWRGPSSQPGGYYLSKFCEVLKDNQKSTVKCGALKRFNKKRIATDKIEGGSEI